MQPISAVLFDLDGTLADTAPDLAYALNKLREQHHLNPLAYNDIRPVASHGSAGLLNLGFGISTDDPNYHTLQQRFIAIYQDNLARQTTLFEGMADVIEQLEQLNIIWGIITNKPAFLTHPLIDALGLTSRASCIVSGDTTAFSKPHPAPMLHACDVIKQLPEQCLYVGDAERDIQAGKNAHMKTVTARYGYLSRTDNPEHWLADAIIDHPRELLQWI